MESFKPHRIPNEEARAGDILVWKQQGNLSLILSKLIIKLKEPDWGKDDFIGWHMTPLVTSVQFIDARSPKVILSSLIDPQYAKSEYRTYRVVETPPAQATIDKYVKFAVGSPYDIKVYILTTLAKLLRPFFDIPRLIDRDMDCWEVTFSFLDAIGFEPADLSNYDYDYPWLPDFLRCVGELPLKTGGK